MVMQHSPCKAPCFKASRRVEMVLVLGEAAAVVLASTCVYMIEAARRWRARV